MARKLISFDWAMKKLLRSKANFGILEGFLSELILEDIKIIEMLESESNKDTRSNKSNRIDLKVKNTKGEIIIIEVQYEREWHYYQRMLFATSKAIVEHIDEGDDYQDIVKVISVNILYFDLGHGSDYVYHGTTNIIGIHNEDELELTHKQKDSLVKESIHQIFPEYYLVKINNFNDKAKNTLDEWIYFLKNQEIKNSFKAKGIKEAKKKLDIMLLPDNKRKEYEAFIEDNRHLRSQFWTARTEGKLEGKLEAAKSLLDVLDTETIAKKLNLTIEQVNELKNNKVSEKPAKYAAKKIKTKRKKV